METAMGTTLEDDYDPRSYPPLAVTVDMCAFTVLDGKLCLLLIKRGIEPFKGQWALPGGFLRTNEDGTGETLDEAAERELREETGLSRVHLEQLGTFGDPGRDPRLRVVSVAYLAFAPNLSEPEAGTDAMGAEWVPVQDLHLPQGAFDTQGKSDYTLAFDHARIAASALERGRAKLEYTPLATAFVDEAFTLTQLREVYEAVWGEELHGPNFRRKVLSVPGFVEALGERTDKGGKRGGPRAELYRAGDAKLLHPALLRAATEDEIR